MDWGTNLDTGAVFMFPIIKSIIPNAEQNASFFAGIFDYVNSLNSEDLCKKRLEKYNIELNKYLEAKDREALMVRAINAHVKSFKIRNRSKTVGEFSLKILFLALLIFLVYKGGWFIALILSVFIGKIVMKFIFSRDKDREELIKLLDDYGKMQLPPVSDPINIDLRLF
jgi:hypothetical protein